MGLVPPSLMLVVVVSSVSGSEYLEHIGWWSNSTRVGYGMALCALASCFNLRSPDVVIGQIKDGELDLYQVLNKYLSQLAGTRTRITMKT
jgi:hypothetical protein